MEQLIERIAKAPTGMKVAVVAIVALVVTAANYLATGVPYLTKGSISEMATKLEKVSKDQRRLDQEMIEKQSIANNLNQFRREKEMLDQQLQEALSELPDDKKLDELLQMFQDRATKAGVDILTIEPQAQANDGFYARIPIPMSVQGGYHEIATFLDSVGRLRRIVNVSSITFDTPKEQGGKVILNAKFMATTFMFTAPAKTGAAKP